MHTHPPTPGGTAPSTSGMAPPNAPTSHAEAPDAPADGEAFNPAADATPTLAGKRVMLRPITPNDYGRLRALELAPQLAWRWRHTGTTPAPETWVKTLWNGVAAQYLVIDHRTQGSDWIGLVAAYNTDTRNGHAHVAAAKFDPDDHTGRLLEGTVLFIDYVLATWPLHKLYLETPAYNLDQIRSEIGRLLVQEGQLTNHTWLNGRLWDLHILALHRTAWDAERHHLLGHTVPTADDRPAPLDRSEFIQELRTELDLRHDLDDTARLIDDHGLDSLELVRLALHLEDTHGVELPEQLDYPTLTLNDVWHYYETQINRR